MGLCGGATAVLLELKVSPKLFGVGERRTNGSCRIQGEDSKVEIGVPWTKRAEDTYEQCSRYLGTEMVSGWLCSMAARYYQSAWRR